MFFINILFHFFERKSIPLCYEILRQLSNVAVLPGQYSIHTILDPWLHMKREHLKKIAFLAGASAKGGGGGLLPPPEGSSTEGPRPEVSREFQEPSVEL